MKPIDLGKSLDPTEDRLEVDPRVFHDDCLLLGTEGSGKTTFATSIFEKLVDAGMSIVAIDTTGDLTDAIAKNDGLTLQRGVGKAGADSTEKIRLSSIDLSMASDLFSAPEQGVEAEFLHEENRNLISALQGLLGFRPRRFSPEFSLLEQIVDARQDAGSGVPLADLPELIRTPPVSRIGMFPLDDCISKDRRLDLAAAVTSLLESPSFAYSSAEPGIDVTGLLRPDGHPRCTVLTFADRSPRIRQFLVAVLGSKLRTMLANSNNQPLIIWVDEASDFIPRAGTTLVSRLLMNAIESWDRFNANFVLVAQQLADLHEDADNHCGTMIVGQTAVSRARDELVQALDLVNPPIDERKLNQDIKALRTGQFILRSRRLETLRRFEIRK